MEILNIFSVADFLAYLFPGMVSLGGIGFLLQLTPWQPLIRVPQDNQIVWLGMLIVLSYCLGAVKLTILNLILRYFPGKDRRKKNKGKIQILDKDLERATLSAFNALMSVDDKKYSKKGENTESASEWNEYKYYICRSLVSELMPKATAVGLREGAYRQLRLNLIGTVLIWGLNGVLWGFKFIFESDFINRTYQINVVVDIFWAWALILFSIFCTIYLIIKLIDMMDNHEQREVREVLTSFLAGYKAGIFHKVGK